MSSTVLEKYLFLKWPPVTWHVIDDVTGIPKAMY